MHAQIVIWKPILKILKALFKVHKHVRDYDTASFVDLLYLPPFEQISSFKKKV